jgi:hypothetical protein
MHNSDVILQTSRQALRLAAECTDEHVAVELHLLAIKLWLAVVKDAELMVEEIPNFAGNASGGK